MTFFHSLYFRIVLLFTVVIAPLVFFLFYNNWFAMNVVRERVKISHENLLSMYAGELDSVLEETRTYMSKLMSEKLEINTLALVQPADLEFMLAKQRMVIQFVNDLNYYNEIDTLYIYRPDANEIIFATIGDHSMREQDIRHHFPALKKDVAISLNRKWEIVKLSGGHHLSKVVDTQAGIFIGALIDVNRLIRPFELLDIERGEEAGIFSLDGRRLTSSSLDSEGRSPSLTVRRDFQYADLFVRVMIPEKRLLDPLLYFQKTIYWIPLIVSGVMVMYLLFLRRMLIKPIGSLIRAMGRVSQGRLDVTVCEAGTREISFLNQSFNAMIAQIKKLKIHVYEEQLKSKQAELKHLQAQINPHFYVNSFDIMYSLSAMGRTDLVQKMLEHLTEYLRFSMSTSRSVIRLDEEMDHIVNYLEIQKLRYPNRLTYEIHLLSKAASYEIFPLTVQPFVENCIVHGMPQRKEPYRIEIHIEEREPGRIEIRVADNGKGFSDVVLKELNEHGLQEGAGRIGIWNVRKRLEVRFGDVAAVTFRNRQGGGAEVTLRIPAIQSEVTKGDGPVV